MTNLDGIFKSRDITLPTKVRLVKAMVFPVVMYGCESWIVMYGCEESWAPKNWCFWTVLEKTLENPLNCKEIQPVRPKGNQSEYSLEGLMLKLKLQYFGHLKRRDNSLEKTLMLGKTEGKRRRGWQRMRWLDGITEFEQAPGNGEGQGSLACCSPWGCKESDTTEWLNNNNSWFTTLC